MEDITNISNRDNTQKDITEKVPARPRKRIRFIVIGILTLIISLLTFYYLYNKRSKLIQQEIVTSDIVNLLPPLFESEVEIPLTNISESGKSAYYKGEYLSTETTVFELDSMFQSALTDQGWTITDYQPSLEKTEITSAKESWIGKIIIVNQGGNVNKIKVDFYQEND